MLYREIVLKLINKHSFKTYTFLKRDVHLGSHLHRGDAVDGAGHVADLHRHQLLPSAAQRRGGQRSLRQLHREPLRGGVQGQQHQRRRQRGRRGTATR